MPYTWTPPQTAPGSQTSIELQLWPHNALKPGPFAGLILAFYLVGTIPLYGMIGTAVFWGLLPFLLAALAALYYALRRNQRDRQIFETLTVTPEKTHLHRTNPKGAAQDWECNTYWVRTSLHQTGGPVPNYVTLKGNGREVEIGAFLSDDERKALYAELTDAIARQSA